MDKIDSYETKPPHKDLTFNSLQFLSYSLFFIFDDLVSVHTSESQADHEHFSVAPIE